MNRAQSVISTFKNGSLRDKSATAISTFFGVGLFPWAPGSMGSLISALLWIALYQAGSWATAMFFFILVPAGIWASGIYSDLTQNNDPQEVVIDEMGGLFLSLFWVKGSLINIFLGFLLFRFFDILKPFPIKAVEKINPRGLAIVGDDLIAGLFANLSLRFLDLFFIN